MSIITISRSFCSKGGLIAEKIADELGYECVSREILIEASEQFNIPQLKLAKAIHDGPSMFERLSHGKERYIAFIRAALLNHLKNDNIVYHGLAGHFFLQNIPHILKVRTLSDMEDRIKEEMERENVSAIVARKQLLHDDRERHNWSSYIYKMDTSDPELYDMILNLKNMSVDDCVRIILNTVKLDYFQSSDEARKLLEDAALGAAIKAAIVEKHHNAGVSSQSGNVVINIPEPVSDAEKIKSEIKSAIKDIKGIIKTHINVKSNALPRTAMHK